MAALPNMRVYLPSDRHQTKQLIEALLQDRKPAYVRVGRNPVADLYSAENTPFVLDQAVWLRGKGEKTHVALIACGETVQPACAAADLLAAEGIRASVLDMYCVKPLDRAAVLAAAQNAQAVVTVEEHSPFGGLGALVAQTVSAHCPRKVINRALPDAPVITGTSAEVFRYYGLDAAGIVQAAKEAIGCRTS